MRINRPACAFQGPKATPFFPSKASRLFGVLVSQSHCLFFLLHLEEFLLNWKSVVSGVTAFALGFRSLLFLAFFILGVGQEQIQWKGRITSQRRQFTDLKCVRLKL